MGLTYFEKIVMDDQEREGYDLVRVDGDGQPDFKVFNFDTGERFWLEVKNPAQIYTELQKTEFPKITIKIIIAIVNKGKITYKDYKTGEVISASSYSKVTAIKPNITCHKCGHGWYTTTKMMKVSCPSCYKKVQFKEFIIKEKKISISGGVIKSGAEVPQEHIDLLFKLKQQGKTADEIKVAINENNNLEYLYSDLPEKTRKYLEE